MMLKVETETNARDAAAAAAAARNSWVRTCDNCYSAAAAVYCRTDFAYLCSSCDATIHQLSALHERVVVCESCESAPAAFLCKADAASLCASCDAEIHSANPLARRHHRVPVQPNSPSVYGRSRSNPKSSGLIIGPPELADDEDEDEAASWLLPNPMKSGEDERRAAVFAGEVDAYLDLDEYNHFNDGYNTQQQQQQHYGVVPFQKEKNHSFDPGFEAEYSYPSSISSMDVGVVPESETEASIISHARPPKGTIELFSRPPPTQLTRMDREARVLRYREKKKTRKFDKTIRYASRKAYAETRPRIKGRFAKRKVAEDYIFSSESDIAYGVVPSF